jgi:DNA segregation ATPase FtsK/SpoIIIE-like protein
VKPMLDRVVTVMKKRMALLEKSKKKDLPSYNRSTDDRLPRILVVIDEMNTFVGLGALTEEIHNLIMLIVSQGRAVGIHLIAATQHPEVKVIPGRIKTNMSVRMSGAMPSIVASQIVLDSADAAKIPNIPGRFVAVVGLQTLVVQVPRIEDGDIAHVVSKAQNDYPETSDELRELSNAPKLKVWDETAVIQAALDWTQGSLSGQKINRLLGSESPGERALNTLCKRVIDAAEANGGFIQHNGSEYKVAKKAGGGKELVFVRDLDVPDVSDVSDGGSSPAIVVGNMSDTDDEELDEYGEPLDAA